MNKPNQVVEDVKRTAHGYLRVSVDGSGIEESQHEQHEDNERARQEHGWRKGRTYKDTGSASRYGTKKRDDFDKLIADLRSGGKFARGDVLQLWESSRGSREQAEWATFLNLLRDNGVLLYITSHRRLYDMNVPRDRRTMDEDGVDSAYESAKTSMRQKRHMAANAAKGRPHGRVPYGYQRVYSATTGRLDSQVPKPGEAEVIRELFTRLAARQSLHSVARDFAARGIVNDSGAPFSEQHLRSLALNHAYAGLRVHDPNRKHSKQRLTPAATMVPGQWEPLVDRRTFYAVQEYLTDPSRRTNKNRPGRGVHLLSMIARCAVCGGPLAARSRNKRNVDEYRCHKKSCVSVCKGELDEFATDTILTALESDSLYEVLTPSADKEAELTQVRAELAELHARHRELAAEVARGALSPSFAARAEPPILADIKKAEDREKDLSTPNALANILGSGEARQDVRARWKSAEMSTKREVARMLFSAPVLGELRVTRTLSHGHHCPVHQRVQWWKGDPPTTARCE